MVAGDDEPPEADPDEGPVLAPEELDISDDDHVTEIDEGRYVVSPDVRPADDPAESAAIGHSEPTSETPAPDSLDRAAVHDWLSADLAEASSRYGFDVTASFDGEITQRRMVSNDVVTIFESLVLWYAEHLDRETPVEEVLGILLAESNVPVRYPPQSLRRLVAATDLGPEDDIGSLLAAVDAADGVEL